MFKTMLFKQLARSFGHWDFENLEIVSDFEIRISDLDIRIFHFPLEEREFPAKPEGFSKKVRFLLP